MRLPATINYQGNSGFQDQCDDCEAILVRKAGDRAPSTGTSGTSYAMELGTNFGKLMTFGLIRESHSESGQGSPASGATRLADGIGVDARKYVESLLSLNR